MERQRPKETRLLRPLEIHANTNCMERQTEETVQIVESSGDTGKINVKLYGNIGDRLKETKVTGDTCKCNVCGKTK